MVSKGYGIFSGRLVKLLSGSRFQVSLMMMFDMNDPILKLGEPPKEMAIRAFADLPSCRPEDFEDVRTYFAGGGDDTSFSESATQKIAPAKVSPRKLKAAERCHEQLSGIVKYGVIEILRAFLKSRKEEFDIAAIKDSIKALTARDGMEPVAELLKPLYLKGSRMMTERQLKSVAENLYIYMRPHLKVRAPKAKQSAKSGAKKEKGKKTRTMARQLKDFMLFVASRNGAGIQRRGAYAVAHDYWLSKGATLAAKAKASGEAKGYSSYVTLANAYRQLPAAKLPLRTCRASASL